jgi:5-methyltetrahydrofolate--homocysteine methyltransferase
MRQLGKEVPIQAQVTVETTGQMLAGSDIASALTALESLPIDIIGMNCATGPDLMDSHIRHLGMNSTRWVSCMPNAGLPRNVGGRAVFDLTPDELAKWHVKFINDYGINTVGGCCGTNPDHIRAVAKACKGLAPGKPRQNSYVPSLSSLYQSVTMKQDTGILLVGERTNATGSKAFRELLFKDDLDGMVALAQEQVADGSHVLDVSVAWTGRNEKKEMGEVMARFATAVQIPIMVDSTQIDVMEEALKHLGGRAIVNSVNLEDGEEKFDRVCELAKRYGAALVALTIDEDKAAGMAKTVERKVEIATRIYERITKVHGIPGSAILFDLLTFPITQGDEDTRKLGLWTLEGISAVKAKFPECGYILGLSNISFGVKPNARRVLNSVYLDEAIQRGLTGAILNASKILPVSQIPEAELKLCRDLIHDRREFAADGECTYDPLFKFVDHFTQTTSVQADTGPAVVLPIDERLTKRIIDGKKIGIDVDLNEAMAAGLKPLDIINTYLLDGMKVVGELFGSGKMQLPFVLQSAETMKAAVKHLQPFMEKVAGSRKGCMVLATVKGDVHDIGKNLVDIILSNNGYEVVNLGIKQSIEDILVAAEQHKPDAIGMSGLLVKSTVVMKENLEYLAARKLDYQVILGGAALNRAYVENDLRGVYNPTLLGATEGGPHRVWYAADAFDGLQYMDELCRQIPAEKFRLTTRTARVATVKTVHEILQEKIAAGKAYVPSDIPAATTIHKPPFWGRQIVRPTDLDLPTICRYINKNALFRGQWGFKQGQELTKAQWQELVDREAEPVFKRWIAKATSEKMLEPQVAYGWWPAAADRNDLVVFDPETGAEVARLNLPRQMESGSGHKCLSDYLRPVGAPALGDEASWIPAAAWAAGARDVIGFSCVTMGKVASEHCQRLFKADNYPEYLYF